MLLNKNNSKRELRHRLKELEKANKELNQGINKSSANKNLCHGISLYLITESTDIVIYSIEEDTLKAIDSSIPLNVLQSVPSNMKELLDIIHDDDKQLVNQAFNKLSGKNLVKRDCRLSLQKQNIKEIIPIELKLIIDKKTNNKIILVIKDISQLAKQKRELNKVKEKAEESDKLKSILLSNISHQIRTPLNSISGFSELLVSSEIGKNKQKDYIGIIKRQSKLILNLIDDISEIAKLESGKINISKTPCNLNLLLHELLIGLNQQRADKRKELVEITLTLPETKEIEFLTDSGRLQQALSNIANFSLRYTQQGKIELGYSLNNEDQIISFFIRDTSDGFTKEEQKVIFNRFMLIDGTENTKLEDPGLGLTIAKEIIKALGGKIWIESEPGAGSSFFFNLPYEIVTTKESDEIIEDIAIDSNFNWSNKVILIVDDEEVNAMFLDAVFQITGVQTIFAKNGLQALDLVKNINKIDLILMDLKMPVMNGIRATSEIRKLNTTIPIIAQTALASEVDKHNSLKAGCNGIITKPIEVEEILKLVNSYFTD